MVRRPGLSRYLRAASRAYIGLCVRVWGLANCQRGVGVQALWRPALEDGEGKSE
jgi:hypothetical protein